MNKEEILNKKFITTNDLVELTGMGIKKSQKVLSEIKQEMINKNMFVPYERKLMIPTKIVRKKLGI